MSSCRRSIGASAVCHPISSFRHSWSIVSSCTIPRFSPPPSITAPRIAEVPVQSFNTPRGTILVSTVEATAVDLVGYGHRVGGLDQVATVLSELAEQIDPRQLVTAAEVAPIPWAQRLGYLLERVGAADKAIPLKAHVQQKARSTMPLVPATSAAAAPRADDWRLRVNAEVEAEA